MNKVRKENIEGAAHQLITFFSPSTITEVTIDEMGVFFKAHFQDGDYLSQRLDDLCLEHGFSFNPGKYSEVFSKTVEGVGDVTISHSIPDVELARQERTISVCVSI
jgi:hypothetical protein